MSDFPKHMIADQIGNSQRRTLSIETVENFIRIMPFFQLEFNDLHLIQNPVDWRFLLRL